MKCCASCKIDKPLTEFYFNSTTNKPHSYCKVCQLRKGKLYIESNPAARERALNRSRQFRLANPDRVRKQIKNAYYKKNYGITYDEFLSMYEASGGHCTICGADIIHKGRNTHKRAVLDHCHKTGKIRGILCHMCNSSIGLMREDKELVMKVYKYLEFHDTKDVA